MELASKKTLDELKPVLQNPKAFGPDPVYWVFSNLSKDKWANLTVIAPGFFSHDLVPTGGELPKTHGHYHTKQVNEIYHLVEGRGILLLQKKHLEGDKWIPEMVDQVVLINANPGDEILIKPEWGHSWSNAGQVPLLSYDNWRQAHEPTDYEAVEKLIGMAYYLVVADNQLQLIPNPNYKNLPQPIWMDAASWKVRQSF